MSGRFIFIGRPPIPYNRAGILSFSAHRASGGLYTFSYPFKVTWLQKEKNAAVMRIFRCNWSVTESVTNRVTSVHQKGKPICLASASVISEKFSASVSGQVTYKLEHKKTPCKIFRLVGRFIYSISWITNCGISIFLIMCRYSRCQQSKELLRCSLSTKNKKCLSSKSIPWL